MERLQSAEPEPESHWSKFMTKPDTAHTTWQLMSASYTHKWGIWADAWRNTNNYLAIAAFIGVSIAPIASAGADGYYRAAIALSAFSFALSALATACLSSALLLVGNIRSSLAIWDRETTAGVRATNRTRRSFMWCRRLAQVSTCLSLSALSAAVVVIIQFKIGTPADNGLSMAVTIVVSLLAGGTVLALFAGDWLSHSSVEDNWQGCLLPQRRETPFFARQP